MPKETWISAVILTIVVIVGVVMLTSGHHNEELERAKAELAEARASAAKNHEEVESLNAKLTEAHSQIASFAASASTFFTRGVI